MQVNSIIDDSMVDGYGLRCVVFTQGCTRCCNGCHNPQTWNPFGGYFVLLDDIVDRIMRNPLCSGLTLSGGEPYMQSEACAELVLRLQRSLELNAHKPINVWVYTGFELDEIINNPLTNLELVTHLVTGAYVQELRDESLLFRGSSNQKIWLKDTDKEKGWTIING